MCVCLCVHAICQKVSKTKALFLTFKPFGSTYFGGQGEKDQQVCAPNFVFALVVVVFFIEEMWLLGGGRRLSKGKLLEVFPPAAPFICRQLSSPILAKASRGLQSWWPDWSRGPAHKLGFSHRVLFGSLSSIGTWYWVLIYLNSSACCLVFGLANLFAACLHSGSSWMEGLPESPHPWGTPCSLNHLCVCLMVV